MRIPTIQGVIDRRMLVNFRVAPATLASILPPPFRPQIARGWGLAGICLIRLKHIRPRFWPAVLGLSSENAAHRIAVEWDEAGQIRTGVFIPRRDTSLRLNAWAGGRIFPGEHNLARFDVRESRDTLHIGLESLDGRTHVLVEGHQTADLPESSIFSSLGEASEFFQRGSLGYSARKQPGLYDGLELRCNDWHVEPLAMTTVESSFFHDPARFPPGIIQFDCALLMRGVRHQWLSHPQIHAGESCVLAGHC